MAIPVEFGRFRFKSKKKAVEEAQERIRKYKEGDVLSTDDEEFFLSMFELHTEHEQKIGIGVKHIEVRLDFGKRNCLFIHRVDGSVEDCSWRHCLEPQSQATVLKNALRRSVKSYIVEVKKQSLKGNTKCRILGIDMTTENSQVAYMGPSFNELVMQFLSDNGLEIIDVELTNPTASDTDQRGILTSNIINKSWKDFHREKSNLELISKLANLRGLKP